MQRNKARPSGLGAESMLRLCDGVYFDMLGHQIIFFLPINDFFLSFLLKFILSHILRYFYFLANSPQFPDIWHPSALFSFSKPSPKTKRAIDHSFIAFAVSWESVVVIFCLFRHSHIHAYFYNSGSLAFTFYSLVPVLQSGVFVCWSEGPTESVGYNPILCLGPFRGDKWSLFLPRHAFWLMLNPFGLIILIAVPAIKTTDSFVQLWALQNVTKGFWGQQSGFLKVDLWLIFAPPPSQIAAECRGTPPCRPGFSEDIYKVVVPDITEKGQPLFNGEWWNFPSSVPCWMLVMSVFDWVCVCRHAHQLCVLASMCYISGRIRTSLTYLNN